MDGPGGVRVPMREIALSGGEPPVRVYDTSGPQGHDVRQGIPALRQSWILERDVTRVEGRESRVESRETLDTGLSTFFQEGHGCHSARVR